MELGTVGMAPGDSVFAYLIIWYPQEEIYWKVEKKPELQSFMAVYGAIFEGMGLKNV